MVVNAYYSTKKERFLLPNIKENSVYNCLVTQKYPIKIRPFKEKQKAKLVWNFQYLKQSNQKQTFCNLQTTRRLLFLLFHSACTHT